MAATAGSRAPICGGCVKKMTEAQVEGYWAFPTPGLVCDGGCGFMFTQEQMRWSCTDCDYDLCVPCSFKPPGQRPTGTATSRHAWGRTLTKAGAMQLSPTPSSACCRR